MKKLRMKIFSTAVDLENDCCEVVISNESPVNCDTINVSMIISKFGKITRFYRCMFKWSIKKYS